MTKWARMRRRKQRKLTNEDLQKSKDGAEKVNSVEPEQVTERIKQESEKSDPTDRFNPKTILAQSIRYVYLVGFFALLAGIFFPLITPGISFDIVIFGTVSLLLGLAGGILLFKAITSEQRRISFIVIGFSLIAISLSLVFYLEALGYS